MRDIHHWLFDLCTYIEEMELGFEKATSHNLPVVDSTMVFEFYNSNSDFRSAELKNVKSTRAARESYGDEAIGYVQVKRVGMSCIVKAKITPEHKVRDKPYRVEAGIDEAEETVVYCKCMDCAASKGGCKHSVAFLLWLHRRSEEPSVTAVECYWKVSKLSRVGSTTKFMTLGTLASKPVPSLIDVPDTFLEEVLQEGVKRGCQGTLFLQECNSDVISKTSMHKLILLYKTHCSDLSVQNFIKFIHENISEKDCKTVQELTVHQNKSSAWYEVRYGRITASKLYEASKCTTFAGSLVEDILGGGKVIETAAMARGKTLEEKVLKKLMQSENMKISNCGVYINRNYPIYGASPDGLTETHVIEVKCPSKEKTLSNYLMSDGNICNKPYAQIQLQMLLAKRSKGYFCVASPDFERTGNFQLIEVLYDAAFMTKIMKEAEYFWKTVIFTHLIKY